MSINFRYESARFAFSDSECWKSIATLDFTWSQSWSHYDLASIQAIREKHKQNLPALVIDCSHGNSGKDPLRQPEVLQQIVAERLKTQVKGVMIESHLVDGNQKISCEMTYGQSVTDGCLGWNKTEQLLLNVAKQLKASELAHSA